MEFDGEQHLENHEKTVDNHDKNDEDLDHGVFYDLPQRALEFRPLGDCLLQEILPLVFPKRIAHRNPPAAFRLALTGFEVLNHCQT